jgi:hypothetical protein
MLVYDFGVQTLARTLLYLGADYVAGQDFHGYTLFPGAQEIGDPWIAAQLRGALGSLAATRPPVGTVLTSSAISLLPPRSARSVAAVLPHGHLVAVAGGFANWLSDGLARKLATEIETWIAQTPSPWWTHVPLGRPGRFYPGL